MTHTDYYLQAADEATALAAAQVEGFDLVTLDEDGNASWNTSPSNGRSAFAVTRGPVVDTVTDEEGNESPVYAEGFFGLLRVPNAMADEISALLNSREGVSVLAVEDAPARFSS